MLFSDNKYVAESSRSEKDKMWGSDWSDLMAGGLLLGPEGHAGFRQSRGGTLQAEEQHGKLQGGGSGRTPVPGRRPPSRRQLTSFGEG